MYFLIGIAIFGALGFVIYKRATAKPPATTGTPTTGSSNKTDSNPAGVKRD